MEYDDDGVGVNYGRPSHQGRHRGNDRPRANPRTNNNGGGGNRGTGRNQQRSSAYNPLQPPSGHRMSNGNGRGIFHGNGGRRRPSPYEPVGRGDSGGTHDRGQQQQQQQHHQRQEQQQQQNSDGGNEGRKKFDGPVFGFKRLFKFLTTDTDEVITVIKRSLKDWEKLLDQDTLSYTKTLRNGRMEKSDDLLYIIVKLLGEKICVNTTVLSSDQNAIVSSTVGSPNFLAKVDDKIKSYQSIGLSTNSYGKPAHEFSVEQDPVAFFKCLQTFFRFVAQKMKTTAVDFLEKIIPSMRGTLVILNMDNPSEQVGGLLEEAHELFRALNAIKAENERKVAAEEVKSRRKFMGLTAAEEEHLHSLPPPDDFREIPVIPTVEEIKETEEVFLRTNKISGAYSDANHYLDVQFRLLREDFVRPLRNGITDFRRNKDLYLSKKKRPPIGNVRLYPKVCYADIKLDRGNVIHYIQLHPDNYKKVKWDKSKRLLSGSLLVFTKDDFVTSYFATVYQRNENELKAGKLAISWEGEVPEFDKQAEFLMVECEVYFEAYRHTLQVLKEIELQSFPMAKFIVGASSDVQPPQYLHHENRHQLMVGNYSCSPLADETWPSAENLGLDSRQFEAYKACLTREFAIVQGPPGTGKTFLALQVVEVFLRNLEVWNPNQNVRPILIVCYTNHALDQFLEGVLRIFEKLNQPPKIVRVGGRSKTPALDEFSLNRLRLVEQRLFPDRNYSRLKGEAHRNLRAAEQARQDAIAEYSALNSAEGILLMDGLRVRSALSGEIPDWILKSIVNPTWFGLHDGNVEHTRVENFLLKTFRVRQTAPEPKVEERNQKTKQGDQQDAHEIDIEEDDEEEYDIAELEENRIVDHDDAELEELAVKASTVSCNLLLDGRRRELQQQLDAVEAKRQKAKNTDLVAIYAEQMEFEKQMNLVRKKEDICRAVLSAYRNKTIETLPVGAYFGENSPEVPISMLSVAERWSVYFHALEIARKLTATEVKRAGEDVAAAQKRWQEVLRMGDGRIISRSLIVGMTTTGAAKYNDLLRMTQSRIVLVEEAAEVLESHIVTCITTACEHLILIGDHQQLRPSTTVYDLAKKYKLDISLFERMVNNQLNCYKINVQHRMRPEIADLVVGTIYPELHNAPSVHLYPPVAGVTTNLFFVDHTHAESSESDSKSKSNEYEAKFMAAFCRYLIQNGYTAQQITILTTYMGQMFLIKQCLRNVQSCQGVRVTCVDNFQGEENDIILLSLVRSNDQGNIGFLKTDNRICVAISRAKHGLYIVGNMNQLKARSPTWRKIEEKLKNRQPVHIGTAVTIQCQVHGTIQSVSGDQEFSRLAPEGGCVQNCDSELDCGHICVSVCHIQDRDHVVYKCKQQCLKYCCRTHQCEAKCFKECPPCRVVIPKTLPCGHETKVRCSNYDDAVTCSERVEKKLPCGHEEELACFVDPQDYTCKVRVTKNLACGHTKDEECHKDARKITCGAMVEKLLPCGHHQMDKCWKPIENIECRTEVEVGFKLCDHKTKILCKDSNKERKCRSPCPVRLPGCGHACTLICHRDDDPDHIHYKCKQKCAKICENGEHRCSAGHSCFKPCPPCNNVVKKRLQCNHEHNLKCHQDPRNHNCNLPCEKQLHCGHGCRKRCSEPCGPCEIPAKKRSLSCDHEQEMPCGTPYTSENCNFKVKAHEKAKCGHEVYVPCRFSRTLTPEELTDYCTKECEYSFVGCRHSCTGTCGDCLQGRVHVKCKEKCGKELVCGHMCDFPCSKACPPCEKKCLMACEHSRCEAKCGEPCVGCAQKCGWKCVHKSCSQICSDVCDRDPCNEPCPKKLECGHDCVGYCGEPCPPQCKICTPEKLTEFMLYGYEEDEDARFVLLEDCGHAIEINGLDYFMTHEINEGEITVKRCPRCKTLIRKSRRYGNILKIRLLDVMKVKKHKYGNTKETRPQAKALAQRVSDSVIIETRFSYMKKYLQDKLVAGKHRSGDIICKEIDISTLASLQAIANFVEEAAAVLDDEAHAYEDPRKRAIYKQSLASLYEKLFDNLKNRKLPLSKQEFNDFEWEFARLFDLNQTHRMGASTRFNLDHPRVSSIWKTLMETVNAAGPYDDKRKNKVRNFLEELDKVMATGLGISDRERRMILSAIGLAEGRWFKCPNGHVYVITECGGAMEESKCNECGATIGGGSHRLRSDNALATEMDGATQPLYPNMI